MPPLQWERIFYRCVSIPNMKDKSVIYFVIAPLLLGAIIYYLFFPQTLFVELIDNSLKGSYHVPLSLDNLFIRAVRFYLLDFLWAFALMGLVIISFGFERKSIVVTLLFIVLMEAIQIFPSVRGTFDACDIGVEVIACILVILLSRRKTIYEKV